MKTFDLDISSPTNGIQLDNDTIDLLIIFQCNSLKELQSFVYNCPQFSDSQKQSFNWNSYNLDELKKQVFESYKSTLISLKESVYEPQKARKRLIGQSHELSAKKDKYGKLVAFTEKYDNKDVCFSIISNEIFKDFGEEKYSKITNFIRRFETYKSLCTDVTYDDIRQVNENLSNFNTISVTEGRYCQVKNYFYQPGIDNSEKFDFYKQKKCMDFAFKNKKFIRYHALLDRASKEKFKGHDKAYIIEELKEYVKSSIDFINDYNSTHKINGRGAITSVDLFNELIFDKQPKGSPNEGKYVNEWQEEFGITIKDLADIFQYAKDHKPNGVAYVYNEPFLEDKNKREAVIEQLRKINRISPGLIDTLGTQMHIEMNQNVKDIEDCFRDFKELEKEGISTQITEFDMCMPNNMVLSTESKAKKLLPPKVLVQAYKAHKIKQISNAIKKSKIHLSGITYWTISDKIDSNLERTNEKIYRDSKEKKVAKPEIVKTRYSGYYSLEKTKEKSSRLIFSRLKNRKMKKLPPLQMEKEEQTTNSFEQKRNKFLSELHEELPANTSELQAKKNNTDKVKVNIKDKDEDKDEFF